MNLTLDTPVRFIPMVGPARAAKLEILGVRTARDFLYHVPFRYNDFSLVSPIARVQPGETVTIKGTVEKFAAFATKTGKRIQEAKVRDDSGVLSVIWFNQPYLRSVIKPGMTIHLAGTISWFGTKLVLSAPEYELFDSTDPATSLHTGRLVPVYPATEGISPKWLRGRIAFLLTTLAPHVVDYLPEAIVKKYQLMSLTSALTAIHFPKTSDEATSARRRLAFDELFLLQTRSYLQKHERETKEKSYAFTLKQPKLDAFLSSLPFQLTHDQHLAVQEILSDIGRTFPMNRLLVGDVGSGKTVVAAAAMYACFQGHAQSAIMAPTQILAQQHYETLRVLLTPLGLTIGLVTGSHKDNGPSYDVLVGTHALLSNTTIFKKLGLVVIDEQHRFGVAQRDTLIQKGKETHYPHILTMTATPIPRTVAKTMMNHMELSTLLEMPQGRKNIKTWVVPNQKRESAYAWMEKQIQETGGQAFIICPFIEESETLATVRAVKKEYEHLASRFSNYSLGLLHGRMKTQEKTIVLDKFRNKTHHILVSTPVVEVGIDIPNATIMLVEAAERFGLSQLHQLRGRVGRSDLASYCLLFTEETAAPTLSRLKILETESSGPRLAEADLTLRGAGDILGMRQHGVPSLKVATFADTESIDETRLALKELTLHDRDLATFTLLRDEAQKSTIESTQD